MRAALCALALLGYGYTHAKPCIPPTPPQINTHIAPQWNVLREYSKPPRSLDVTKSVCVGIITLNTQNPLKLKSFTLDWNGPHLSRVYTSLYHRRKHADFATLHSNLVCDGIWNEKNQQIVFPINDKVIARQHYYLVLGTTDGQESILKSGAFKLTTATERHAHQTPSTPVLSHT